MTEMTMGRRIAEERKKLGLSQEALGEKMGVSRQAISKWEADGAVPEIDKFIALSRLYDVSVGWLLGVEEPAKQQDGLSVEQMKLVEELVKQYQPQPRKQSHRWSVLAWAVCAVLFLVLFLQVGSLGSTDTWLSASMESLRTEIVELRRSVNALSAVSAPEASEQDALLADYSLEIFPMLPVSGGEPGAEVKFSAVPNSWQEGDKGYLFVRGGGMETARQECDWDGAFLTAAVPLEVRNGYELCFALIHADGTQEQQNISNHHVENLKSALEVTAIAEVGSVNYRSGALTLRDGYLYVSMPELGMESSRCAWSRIELVLYQNSIEVGRHSLTYDDEMLESTHLESYLVEVCFEGLALQENDDVQLWISAELNNGLSAINPVMFWVTDAHLNLIDNNA